MVIRIAAVPDADSRHIQFPTHALATQLLGALTGIELGPSAHNHFDLPGSISVATRDDYAFYKQYQIDFGGAYAEIEVFYDGVTLPFEDGSQQYVLSSHVLEHIPDVLGAFHEWERVLADGGLVFLIVPQRDADPHDATRPLSTRVEIERVHTQGWTADDFADAHNGHCWVFTTETLKTLIEVSCPAWALVAEEMPDTKVGNGFTLVYRVSRPLPVEVEIEPAPEAVPPGRGTTIKRSRKREQTA